MADEGFEAYHVPQQSRRDKLREQLIVAQNQPLLQSFYDSSLMNTSSSSSSNSSSLSLSHHAFFNQDGFSIPNLNQSNNIQVFGNSPFLYQPQNVQNINQNMIFKPEALSLSLSSSQRSVIPFHGLVVGGGGGSSGSVPFTGYASVLKDSRFLKATMELLEEMCDVGVSGICGEKVMVVADESFMEHPFERSLSEDPVIGDRNEGRNNKSRLLTMLDEVYRRYRQYYEQMQAVVTSFEYVSGLNNAAPYASLAIKSMSKHFRCLKKAITDQIHFTNKANHFHLRNRKDGSPRFGNNERVGPYSQQQQPVWRPQRGLPDRAVTVLRAWLFEHFLHPYPTDTDKIMLAKQTGLSRSQVSNWFINARVRLWKPMVEEIHTLETNQAPKNNEHSKNKASEHFPSDTSLVSENPSSSLVPNILIRSQQQQQLNLPQQVGVGMNMGGASSNTNSTNNNSVSLTLGLYQNHGIGLAEQTFPLSAAQRFGLETTNNEGYVMSGFESQNRHNFGRDHVNIGGQMFHDFVG